MTEPTPVDQPPQTVELLAVGELPAPARASEIAYTLTCWDRGSARYGACQVCGGYASETYHQIECVSVERSDAARARRDPGRRYYWRDQAALTGHRGCLLAQRKAGA